MDKYFGLDTLMDFKGLNSNERFPLTTTMYLLLVRVRR